jgi:hypothetical protein
VTLLTLSRCWVISWPYQRLTRGACCRESLLTPTTYHIEKRVSARRSNAAHHNTRRCWIWIRLRRNCFFAATVYGPSRPDQNYSSRRCVRWRHCFGCSPFQYAHNKDKDTWLDLSGENAVSADTHLLGWQVESDILWDSKRNRKHFPDAIPRRMVRLIKY